MSSHDRDPTTLLRNPPAMQPVTSPGCTLTVVSGPGAGAQHRIDDLTTRRVLLGQSVACDVKLEDRSVSRRHAALEMDSAGLRVVDLDSTNGTWVNGVRVKDAYLPAAAVVQVGSTSLRVDLDATTHVLPASEERTFHRVIGASPEMRRLYPVFGRLAGSTVPVLIEGETGTGKEVLAESLHEASARKNGPFVIFDCTTVAPSLVEAELFGYERGAFTGAEHQRKGLFEEADGGTLFLDEIGDLDLALQAKLLRALEKSEVRRIGSTKWIKVDVRVLAATRRDLDREVQARRFRDDLFYRLAVGRVELPPLRRRQGDIALLTRVFWVTLGAQEAALPPDLLLRFEQYGWPGNVRELYNAVARRLAIGEDGLFSSAADGMPHEAPATSREDFINAMLATGVPLPLARQQMMAAFEQRYVQRMLEQHGGNVSRAAEASGIGRRYFQMIKARK
ncbi:MAG TPA: sigma 54-interacting transcriptional regulator [Polyangiaceae bacterium]